MRDGGLDGTAAEVHRVVSPCEEGNIVTVRREPLPQPIAQPWQHGLALRTQEELVRVEASCRHDHALRRDGYCRRLRGIILVTLAVAHLIALRDIAARHDHVDPRKCPNRQRAEARRHLGITAVYWNEGAKLVRGGAA